MPDTERMAADRVRVVTDLERDLADEKRQVDVNAAAAEKWYDVASHLRDALLAVLPFAGTGDPSVNPERGQALAALQRYATAASESAQRGEERQRMSDPIGPESRA